MSFSKTPKAKAIAKTTRSEQFHVAAPATDIQGVTFCKVCQQRIYKSEQGGYSHRES